jgi:hypothetical protein
MTGFGYNILWLYMVILLWLIIHCFTSYSKFFNFYGNVTIANKGLQNFRPMFGTQGLEQGGIYTVPHLLWHGASVYLVLFEGPPNSVAS